MKTLVIRLPAVEMAMLLEVQKKNKKFRDLERLVIDQIKDEYFKLSKIEK